MGFLWWLKYVCCLEILFLVIIHYVDAVWFICCWLWTWLLFVLSLFACALRILTCMSRFSIDYLIMHFPCILLNNSSNSIHFLFKTIIKPSFPQIDNFLNTARNKIITFSAKLSNIWRIINRVLKSIHFSIPYFSYTILRWTY